MKASEIRRRYIEFFKNRNHAEIKSAPLIPENDPTCLFTTAGMHPLVPYLLGAKHPSGTRLTDYQKCIRTGDIDEVGDPVHLTFFEMLGNWSLGDYFKKEMIGFSFEFLTGKENLNIPADMLAVTVFAGDEDCPFDEEAYNEWRSHGIPAARIAKLGKKDNWWGPAGTTGPCGPDTEMFYWTGPLPAPETFDPGDKRWVEIWNDVFMQYNKTADGKFEPLAQKNVDTGMGLERVTAILQGKASCYETEIFAPIFAKLDEIRGIDAPAAVRTSSERIIADHLRAATFILGDGITPGKVDQPYVLRRLIRRACRHGRLLGVNEPFLYKVCDTVIHENHVAYPELADKAELIKKIILSEEESFGKTIDAGLAMLDEYISKLDGNVFSGEDAFKLNDTFGFPLDLTKDILEEKGITVDEDKFNALLAAQKATARAARKDAGADAWKGNSVKINASATDFLGYTDFACDAKVLAIVNADGELVDMLGAGDSGTLVLDKTPFYAQSGGQVGDSGVIKNGADNAFIVADTAKNADKIFLHRGEVTRGIVSVGDTVQADINAERRRSIMRNHTAAHLLQAALRQVLGTHVEQAGQLVDEREVRFDFTHFNAMTRDELLKVEHLVNAFIMGAHPVESMEMPIDEAKKLGAMMLFGEKYGNIVRVVKAGDFSTEFCGGTHVSNSGQIGLFHIVSEASVASGVRRITALTGSNVLAHIYQADGMLSGAAAILKSAVHDLPEKLAALADSDKAKDKEIKSLKEELAHLKSADLFAAPVDLDGLAFYTATLTDVAPDALRSMGDELKNKGDNVVAVVAGVNGEKANIVAVCGKEAIARGVKAGDVVREIAKLAGGGGGGRPDSAMAGCKNVDKLPDAMAQAAALVRDMIQ